MEGSDHEANRRDQRELDVAEALRHMLQTNRAALTDTEHLVIRHRFALETPDTAKPLTLEQVGRMIGLTEERVRQVQNVALAKIRRSLETDFLDGPQQPPSQSRLA